MTEEPLSERVVVKESPGRGRGVFALRDFGKGELIETAPVIVLPPEDRPRLNLTTFHRYEFSWPRVKGAAALPLGYGAIYNHSPDPNARWENDPDDNFMHFLAVRPIAKGEEIMTNYGRGGYWKETVDPPPWWSPAAARWKRVFNSRRGAAMLVAGGAILVLAVRRRARGSSAGSE